MSVASVASSAVQPSHVHHGHHAHGTGGASKTSGSSSSTQAASEANETVEQLAEQGDPIAIAELRADRPQTTPSAESPTAAGRPTAGAQEPGKGEQVDAYA